QIRTQTTLVLASNDQTIPGASSIALARAFSPGVARVVILADTDHNSIAASPEYVSALAGTARVGQ
ncbi:MAG TPA: hypothetical protein VF594_06000, partial [Rubricoccaceae bacterium]